MSELSSVQQKMLRFLGSFVDRNGFPPSYREIMEALDMRSKSHVKYHLDALEAQGHIEVSAGKARGIRLRNRTTNGFEVPLLGQIVAGEPVPVPDGGYLPYGYETVELTRDIVKETDGLYALKVSGDSMVDAYIQDGDIVIMEHTETVENGTMVAARVRDEETTLKRIFREGRQVRLQPENGTMKPMWFDASDVKVQGKVLAVIRPME